MEKRDLSAKKPRFSPPVLTAYSHVERLTMGSGGSSLDGTGLYSQKGQGNDNGPGMPGGRKK